MQIILLFPGQGSQKPGMGKELSDSFTIARDVFALVDETVGRPVSTLCFNGPAEELTLTGNAQPALYAHGAAAWAVVRDTLAPHVVAAAGHSLGELTAYHASGAFTLTGGATLVGRRGEVMQDLGSSRPGGMAAIIGSLTEPIEAICEQATREAGLVVTANYNSDMQTVVSGEVAGVERAMELAKSAGAKRALRLPVSGAFHSPLMAPAEVAFAGVVQAAQIADPSFPVYANVTAAPVTSADDVRTLILRQITSPVRWVDEMREMARSYPEALYVELGPGRVLSGLVSRTIPGARTAPCATPADVEELMGMLA